MSAKLVCVGDTVIDVTVTVSALPAPGGDILADGGAMLAGGSGFNVMSTARRLGAPAAYGGIHGTGPFGELARAAMLAEGIEILLDPDTDVDSGWDIAITDASSERTFLTVVGAEARLTAERIAKVAVNPGDVVYVSGYGLLSDPNASTITNWLSQLPQSVTVVTDPGPLIADIPALTLDATLEATSWWSCNHAEATAMTGESDPVIAARMLASDHRGVIVRLGADGCLIMAPGEDPKQIAAFPVEPVDTNGAGDTHVGAFIAAILTHVDPVTAARLANAASAIAVTRRGPATGPTSEELDRFMETGR